MKSGLAHCCGGVGMPETLWLDEFGSKVWDAFGGPPYLVGSALTGQKGKWRDVDVRVILSDEEYAAWGFGDPLYERQNAKWIVLCLAFSALGKQMTGLPIDFQIQQQTHANELFKLEDGRSRSALGLVPLRFKEAHF
jgi:hypothetical protein